MPRYKDLEDMYEKHHEKGVEIVDAPCSQFKGHAPGTDWEIHQFSPLQYAVPADKETGCGKKNIPALRRRKKC